jgi:hypothetical protein
MHETFQHECEACARIPELGRNPVERRKLASECRLGNAADNLGYLLKFDTAYGRWTRDVSVHDGRLYIDGEVYPVLRKGTGQAALAQDGDRCRV